MWEWHKRHTFEFYTWSSNVQELLISTQVLAASNAFINFYYEN